MVDVFISYPRVDRARVELIKREIEKHGFSVFFDAQSLDAGDEFPDEIDRAVKSASVVLACWTPHALTRPWVKKECRVGQRRGVLIPISIEELAPDDIPVEFEGVHIIGLVGVEEPSRRAGWPEVIRAINQKISKSNGPVRTPQQALGAITSATSKSAFDAMSLSPLFAEAIERLALTLQEWTTIESSVNAKLREISDRFPLAALPEEVRDAVSRARFVEAQALVTVQLCGIACGRADIAPAAKEPERRAFWDLGRKQAEPPVRTYPHAFGTHYYALDIYDEDRFSGMWREGHPNGFGDQYVADLMNRRPRSSTEIWGLFSARYATSGPKQTNERPFGFQRWSELHHNAIVSRTDFRHDDPALYEFGVLADQRIDLASTLRDDKPCIEHCRYEGALGAREPHGAGALWLRQDAPLTGIWVDGALPNGVSYKYPL